MNEINLGVNSQILLTVPLSEDMRVTDRKIYRTKANGSEYYLLTTLPIINIIYTDNTADSGLGVKLNSKVIKGINYSNGD